MSPTPVQMDGDFQALYRSEIKPVWSFLRRLGAQGKDLEDLVQEVFVTAYQKLDTFDRSRPVRPWLLGIAFRRATDHRRLVHHQREVVGMEEIERHDERADLERGVLANEAREIVYRALALLPLDRRALVVMHDLEGHSVPAIAEALGTPLNTTYSRLRLAREQFAKAVRETEARGREVR